MVDNQPSKERSFTVSSCSVVKFASKDGEQTRDTEIQTDVQNKLKSENNVGVKTQSTL